MDPVVAGGTLNASGFPLQIKIAQEIRDKPGKHNCKVLAEEYAWRSSQSGEFGFIDIIAGYGVLRLVIECKRGADATWLFLTDKTKVMESDSMHAMCTDRAEGQPDIKSWSKYGLKPRSAIASFCIVRGQADKEPMLERTATNLLSSADSLASEELVLSAREGDYGYKFYVPMIITTAKLLHCRIDPKDIDLSNGKVAPKDADCESVGMIRFQKSFGTVEESTATSIEGSHQESLRTVLVLHATELSSFVDQMDLYNSSIMDPWPHELIRSRMRTPSGK
jgi:hypothetical protein